MDKKAFGKRLKEARRKANLTSDKLSELCDCTPVSIRQIESGTRLPSLPKLLKLCNVLKVSPEYLLGAELRLDIEKIDNYNIKLGNLMKELQSLPPREIEMISFVIKIILNYLKESQE